MRVKVDGKIYDSSNTPICLIFDNDEQRKEVAGHLTNMEEIDSVRKYLIYPDTISNDEAKEYMNIETEKYYKCNKCGQSIVKGESAKDWPCGAFASYRVSGICGGSHSVEITEETYNSMIANWEKLRQEKND